MPALTSPPAEHPSDRPGPGPRGVVLVSNRLPVTVGFDDDQLALSPSAGGLATALRHVHAGASTRWVGWPGELGRIPASRRAEVDAGLAERRFVPVELSSNEITRYYDGFANGVLWPLCHYLIDRVQREATDDWDAYRVVNQRFAHAVAAIVQPGELVWIHDYHLMLVPALLRRLKPEISIGFFLHIPFPAAEVFRILPWREPVLRGLLAADLVGFHTAEYAHQFRYAATQLVGAEDQGEDLAFEDRRIEVRAHPIGIDAAGFAGRASTEACAQRVAEWRQRMHGNRVILGVDRLDYTKGIPRRLLAVERLFERCPEWRERVQMIQLAVPTREQGREYVAVRRDVHELVGRINGRFGTAGWTPIQFLHRSVDEADLAALYRAADVMLVTPLRDGMNLVAKEFCASRVDDRGVLVLSELAGAATELREALLVNPFDLDSMVAAIGRALAMPAAEQSARMRALRSTVDANDVVSWASGFLTDLARATPAAATAKDAGSSLSGPIRAVHGAPRRLLLLDYDGTLVPLAPMPELAFPDEELRRLLATIGAQPGWMVHVVSGRSRDSLESWLGDVPIGLHAEHGVWSRWPGEAWTSHVVIPPPGLAAVDAVMTDAVRRTPGTFVERKAASLAWHYRMAEPLLAMRRLADLRHRLATQLAPDLALLDGAKVLEVRARGADKGVTAARIVERLRVGGDGDLAILAIGDDRTDEDMFANLPQGALTVRVGPGVTVAHHRLEGPDDVRALLRALL